MEAADGATDWVAWHRDYADPTSALSQRLGAVVARTRDSLDVLPTGPVRLISSCAGQGLDVLAALEGHPRSADVVGRLVEADPHNSSVSARAFAAAGLGAIESVCGDASTTDAYVGSDPADLMLLCGIFGNISDEDVRNTVVHASMLCSPGAHVIWTRHRREPDLTPSIRRWFDESGFEEVAFDSPGPGMWSVGAHRLVSEPVPLRQGVRLFTFIR
jgi:hypothetical protein